MVLNSFGFRKLKNCYRVSVQNVFKTAYSCSGCQVGICDNFAVTGLGASAKVHFCPWKFVNNKEQGCVQLIFHEGGGLLYNDL